jgi:hypothetical protein
MANQQEDKIRQECQQSLIRVQQFDPRTLARDEELGRDFSFEEAIPAAKRQIALYNQVSQTVLEDFPVSQFDLFLRQCPKSRIHYATRRQLMVY